MFERVLLKYAQAPGPKQISAMMFVTSVKKMRWDVEMTLSACESKARSER